jgi:hypothetical protein
VRRDLVLLFGVLAIVLLVFTYLKKDDARDSYMKQKEELLTFEKEAKELGVLKNKQNKKTVQRVIQNLKKIQAPSKNFKKSGTRVLVFSELDASKLNRVIKKLQNSTLEIVKLDIIRESESSSKVKVEFKQ